MVRSLKEPVFFFFLFIFISWRLITLQYCSVFCHTLTWISRGFTRLPHPNPPSHLPLHLLSFNQISVIHSRSWPWLLSFMLVAPESGRCLLSLFRKIKLVFLGASVTAILALHCQICDVSKCRKSQVLWDKPAHLCFCFLSASIYVLTSSTLLNPLPFHLLSILQKCDENSPHFYNFSLCGTLKISSKNSSKNQLLVWLLKPSDNEMDGYLPMSNFSNCFSYWKSRDQANIQIRDLKPKNILTSQDSKLKNQSRQPPANKGWIRKGIGKEVVSLQRKKIL